MRNFFITIKRAKQIFLFSTCIILIVSTTLLSILLADALSPIINAAMNGAWILRNILVYSGICLALIIFSMLRQYSIGLFSANIEKNMYNLAIKMINDKKIYYVITKNTGFFASIIHNDLKQVCRFLSNEFYLLIYQPILIIGSTIFLYVKNASLTIILILIVLLSMFIGYFKGKNIKKYSFLVQKSQEKMMSFHKEVFSCAEEIGMLSCFNYVANRYEYLNENLMRNEIQRDRIIAFYSIPSMVNEYFPLVMTIILGGYYVYKNRLSYGDFAVFIQILTYLSLPSSKYASALISFRSTQVSLDRFLSLDDQSEKDFDVDDVGKKENNIPDLQKNSSLLFENVSFSYDGSNPVLNDISFELKTGEKAVIVGPSGCGKSTLLRLAMGFYPDYSGIIQIGGCNFKEFNLATMRKNIAFVDQNFYILPGTVSFNITAGQFSDINQNYEAIIKCAKDVGLDQFIQNELSNGYNEILYQKGVNLSGGQKAKLSIARALYRNTPIIFFDEITSSLDAESEKIINDLISTYENKTILAISHRVSTISAYDKILVLNEKGQLCESGSFDELLREGIVFKKIYFDMQA